MPPFGDVQAHRQGALNPPLRVPLGDEANLVQARPGAFLHFQFHFLAGSRAQHPLQGRLESGQIGASPHGHFGGAFAHQAGAAGLDHLVEAGAHIDRPAIPVIADDVGGQVFHQSAELQARLHQGGAALLQPGLELAALVPFPALEQMLEVRLHLAVPQHLPGHGIEGLGHGGQFVPAPDLHLETQLALAQAAGAFFQPLEPPRQIQAQAQGKGGHQAHAHRHDHPDPAFQEGEGPLGPGRADADFHPAQRPIRAGHVDRHGDHPAGPGPGRLRR